MGVQFRWYSGDSDNVPAGPQPPVHRRRPAYWLVALALACLAAVGGIYWQSQRGLRAARADLQRVVDREVEALRTGNQEGFIALLDSRYAPWLRYHEENFGEESAWYAARPGVRAQVESVELKPDLAAVRIRLRNERGAQTEPVDWFYRRVDGAWRHAPPDAVYWGATARIETDHIAMDVPSADEAAASRLAPELEKLWCDLTASYTPRQEVADVGHFFLRIVPYGRSLVSNSIPSPQLALDLWSAPERLARLQREARFAVARSALVGAVSSKPGSQRDDWLLESLALWHAGGLTPEWRARIRDAIADGSYRDLLDSLEPGDQAPVISEELRAAPEENDDTAPLLYALGEFLGNSYSTEELRDLLLAADTATSRWDAIRTVLGLDPKGLSAAWEAYLQGHYAIS